MSLVLLFHYLLLNMFRMLEHPLQKLATYCGFISCVVLLWFDVCWCYGVVRLGWCGILIQAEACIRITIKTMHGPINTRAAQSFLYQYYRRRHYSAKPHDNRFW